MTRRAALTTIGGALVLGAIVLGILVVTLPEDATTGLDTAWNDAMAGLRAAWLVGAAHVLNDVGGGWIAIWVVPPLVALVLVAVRRRRAAVFAAAAFLLSAGLVQVLKHLFGRARPDDMLVASDFGSFPSGHTANAATIAVVLWVVLPRVRVALLGVLWTLLMAFSRTVLSVHWVTDTVGGMLAGAGAALLLAGLVLPWLDRDRPASVTTRRGDTGDETDLDAGIPATG